MKYFVTIHYTDTVEAESEEEAKNVVFEDLDNRSNWSIALVLNEFHTTVTPVKDAPVQQ